MLNAVTWTNKHGPQGQDTHLKIPAYSFLSLLLPILMSEQTDGNECQGWKDIAKSREKSTNLAHPLPSLHNCRIHGGYVQSPR